MKYSFKWPIHSPTFRHFFHHPLLPVFQGGLKPSSLCAGVLHAASWGLLAVTSLSTRNVENDKYLRQPAATANIKKSEEVYLGLLWSAVWKLPPVRVSLAQGSSIVADGEVGGENCMFDSPLYCCTWFVLIEDFLGNTVMNLIQATSKIVNQPARIAPVSGSTSYACSCGEHDPYVFRGFLHLSKDVQWFCCAIVLYRMLYLLGWICFLVFCIYFQCF